MYPCLFLVGCLWFTRNNKFDQSQLTLYYTLLTIRRSSCHHIFRVHPQLPHDRESPTRVFLSFPPRSFLHTQVLGVSPSSALLFRKLWLPLNGRDLISLGHCSTHSSFFSIEGDFHHLQVSSWAPLGCGKLCDNKWSGPNPTSAKCTSGQPQVHRCSAKSLGCKE